MKDIQKTTQAYPSPPLRWWCPLRALVSGTAVLLPVLGTALVVGIAVSIVYEWVGPSSKLGGFLAKGGVSLGASELLGYLIGLAVVGLLVIASGFLVELGFRHWFGRLSDLLSGKIPIVRGVYETIKNFASMLSGSADSPTRGMVPVWCRFGGLEGPRVLGLLSCPESVWIDGEKFMAVIIPTAPVPIGGGLYFLPVSHVTPAEGIGVEGLTSIYVSMGASSPQFLTPPSSYNKE